MALGYLSPCGKLVLKKHWKLSENGIKKVKINNASFFNAFKDLIIRENPNLSHYNLKTGRHYNRKYKVTPNTKKKLLNAMYMLIETYKHRLYMITLTYPVWKNEEPNDHIKAFTKSLKETYGVKDYFWVKEIQEERSKKEKQLVPHFHIVCDLPFIDINKLRSRWYSVISQHDVELKYGLNYAYLHYDDKNKKRRNKWNMLRYVAKYLSKYCAKSERIYKSKVYEVSYGINMPVIPVINMKVMERLMKNIRENKNLAENGVYKGEYYDFAWIEEKKAVREYKKNMKSCIKQIESCLHQQEESRNLERDKEIMKEMDKEIKEINDKLKYYEKKFSLLEKIK